jgi:hypothetical protein
MAVRVAEVHRRWSFPLERIQSGRSLLRDPNLLRGINKIGEPSTVLLNRRVFDTVGYFSARYQQLADAQPWLRVLAEFNVGFVPEVLSTFRIHPTQLSIQNREANRHLADGVSFLRTLLSDAIYPHLHPQVRRTLRRWASRRTRPQEGRVLVGDAPSAPTRSSAARSRQ